MYAIYFTHDIRDDITSLDVLASTLHPQGNLNTNMGQDNPKMAQYNLPEHEVNCVCRDSHWGSWSATGDTGEIGTVNGHTQSSTLVMM